jgi:predicted nuclease of predicted toxin-antitoxin system
VKILLDECVDRRLARDLAGHSVTTVPRRGWAGIKNGELLALAEKEFDAFITADRKLGKQQDLTKFDIAVVLIRSRSNRLEDIRPLVPELLGAISRATRRALTSVGKP